jgi:multiple sugar transport system substrate-binding protein
MRLNLSLTRCFAIRPAQRILALALLAVLVGCGRQGPVDIGACDVALPAAPTTVNVISYESPGMPFFGEQMAKCSRGKQLQVRHQMLPYEELVNQATISMSSPTPAPYHIIHVYDQLLVEWAFKGWLSPLDDLVAKYRSQYQLDEIPQNIWDQMRIDGHIYAIPAIQNVETFFYRKDLFAKHQLKVPLTFDDLESLCNSLKTSGEAKYPLVMMYSKMSYHFTYEFHNLLHSMGGSWFHADGTPAFNDRLGVAALEKMMHLYRTCLSPDAVNLTPEDAVIGLEQGQYLMAVLWMNEAPQLDDPAISRFPGKFGFAPAPGACPTCAPAGYWAQDSWVIPRNPSVDRDLLFRIAMEGLKSRNQAAAANITLVTRPGVARGESSSYWRPGLDSIQRGAVGPDRLAYSYLAKESIERYGMEALLGHLSAQAALDEAARATSESMRREGFAK